MRSSNFFFSFFCSSVSESLCSGDPDLELAELCDDLELSLLRDLDLLCLCRFSTTLIGRTLTPGSSR